MRPACLTLDLTVTTFILESKTERKKKKTQDFSKLSRCPHSYSERWDVENQRKPSLGSGLPQPVIRMSADED